MTKTSSTWKKLLALILAVCSIASLAVPVSAVEETVSSESNYEFPEFGDPVYMGEPLKGGVSATENVVRYNYEGKDYLLVPTRGSSMYVFKLSDYLNSDNPDDPEANWIYDEENTGINAARGIAMNSKGIAYVIGDKPYVYSYDFATGLGKPINLPITRGACRGIAIDDDDNVYITTFAETSADPSCVYKVTPEGEASLFFSTLDLYDIDRGCVYGDGYLYINGTDKKTGIDTKIYKINIKTGQKEAEYFVEKGTRLAYMSLVDGVLFVGNTSAMAAGVCAFDVKTGERLDIGVNQGYIMGIVTEPKDGKSYMMINGIGTFEYDVATRKATIMPGLYTGLNLRIKNPYLTVTKGSITGECMISVGSSYAMPVLMSLEGKGYTKLEGLVEGSSAPAVVKTMGVAPEGDDAVIYIGGILTPRVGSYSPSYPVENAADPDHVMMDPEEFSNGHDQTDSLTPYKGKLYVGAYNGAYLLEYDPATDEVKELMHGLKDKYNQIRMHGAAVGDDKVFFSTIPNSHILGGCIGWYDLITGEVYVEENVVPNQCLISLVYDEETNLLYGASTVSGGSSSIPTEDEALIMVYDVEQRKVLGNFSVRSAANKNSDIVFDLENGDLLPPFIAGIGRDPNTGKFWGLVSHTLFSFKYDKKTNSLHIHEEWNAGAKSKSSYSKSNGNSWLPRAFFFDGNGNMYVGLDTQKLRRFKTDNPQDQTIVAYTGSRCYVMGTDGNLYYADGYELYMIPLNRISIVEGLVQCIDLNNRASVKEARAAYNALTDEEKAQVKESIVNDLSAKEGAAKIFQDISVEKAIEAIEDIGAITAGSGAAIAEARRAYDVVDDECKASVTNLADLVKAEEVYARICADAGLSRKIEVALEFTKSANPNIGDTAIDGITYNHIANGNWEFVDTSSVAGFKIGSGWMVMNFAADSTNWLVIRVRFPQAGVYQLSMEHSNYSGCLGGIYMFPDELFVETYKENVLTEIGKKLNTSEHFVGNVDYTKDGTSQVGTWVCPEAGEYLMVFNSFGVKDGFYGRIYGATFTQNLAKVDSTIESVKEKINAIGKVTLKSGDKISAARVAYDALTNAQKKLIYAPTLEAAEAAYKQLKAEDDVKQIENNAAVAAVKIRIDAIGKVTTGSGSAIRAARQAYDALTKEQKKLVPNLDVLEAAEAEYELLVGGSAEEGSDGTLIIVLIIVGAVVVAGGATFAIILAAKKKKKKQASAQQQDETKTPDEILND